MKKFLFSLTMLAAVALAGFTTSCGGNDDDGDLQDDIQKVYDSEVGIYVVDPEDLDTKEYLTGVQSDVNLVIKPSTTTLDLKIEGIDLSSIGVPAVADPFNVELTGVPYVLVDGVYNINYVQKIELPFASVSAEMQYLRGSIQNNTIELEIFAIGSEDLLSMPVLISVNGTEKN